MGCPHRKKPFWYLVEPFIKVPPATKRKGLYLEPFVSGIIQNLPQEVVKTLWYNFTCLLCNGSTQDPICWFYLEPFHPLRVLTRIHPWGELFYIPRVLTRTHPRGVLPFYIPSVLSRTHSAGSTKKILDIKRVLSRTHPGIMVQRTLDKHLTKEFSIILEKNAVFQKRSFG